MLLLFPFLMSLFAFFSLPLGAASPDLEREMRSPSATIHVDNEESQDSAPYKNFGDFLFRNRAYVVKILTRNIIHKLVMDYLVTQKTVIIKMRKNTDGIYVVDNNGPLTLEGHYAPQGEAGDKCKTTFIDNGIKYTLSDILDATIKSDDEHWAVSACVTGLFNYLVEQKGLLQAAGSAVQNYLYNSACADHLGKYEALWYIMPFFIDSLADDKPALSWNFSSGLATTLGNYVVDGKGRLQTHSKKGSLKDNLTVDLIAWALIPAMIAFLGHKKAPAFFVEKFNTETNTVDEQNGTDTYLYQSAQPTC